MIVPKGYKGVCVEEDPGRKASGSFVGCVMPCDGWQPSAGRPRKTMKLSSGVNVKAGVPKSEGDSWRLFFTSKDFRALEKGTGVHWEKGSGKPAMSQPSTKENWRQQMGADQKDTHVYINLPRVPCQTQIWDTAGQAGLTVPGTWMGCTLWRRGDKRRRRTSCGPCYILGSRASRF